MREEYKKTIRLTKKNIEEAKELITAYGACYLEATGEADNLCAELVKNKIVYGCISEDMDMFVYGCNRVFRNINIYNETMDFYDYVKILKQLKVSSDYNQGNIIFQTFKVFKNFKKDKEGEFYLWLVKNNYINDCIKLYQIYFMFDIIENKRKKMNLELNDVDKSILNSILRKSGFIINEDM